MRLLRNSPERIGQRAVAWKQVWNWFQNRRHAQKAKIEKSKAVASGVAPGGGETPPAPKPAAVAGTSKCILIANILSQECLVYEVNTFFLLYNITLTFGRRV